MLTPFSKNKNDIIMQGLSTHLAQSWWHHTVYVLDSTSFIIKIGIKAMEFSTCHQMNYKGPNQTQGYTYS